MEKGRVFKLKKKYTILTASRSRFKAPAFINLQQYYVEQFLIEKLKELE